MRLNVHLIVVLAVYLVVSLLFAACSDTASVPEVREDAMEMAAEDMGGEVLECRGGMVLWPQGICAPLVDKCEAPWELPLIGGGCVAVGPRACPKTWAPPRPGSGQANADVDCEPGELLPCPEGFVLTEDEVACIPLYQMGCEEMAIPVLGGGCWEIGPVFEGVELPPPPDGKCGAGKLALGDGGCLQAGPRACPKLWDPQSNVNCEIGDVLPCPENFKKSDDGSWCRPVLDECDAGERPVPGGGCQRVIKLEKYCSSGPFPEAPDDVSATLYVDAASNCIQDCGSMELPYSSLQDAVDSAGEGAAVLLAAGDYAEGVLIDKPVQLIGLCAAKTTISGTIELDEETFGKLGAAGIAVANVSGVRISNLTVTAPAVGVVLTAAADFGLNDVEVTGSNGAGLVIEEKSQGYMERLCIHDLVKGEGPGLEGLGLWVRANSAAAFNESLIESVIFSGAYVEESGSKLSMEESAIRSTQQNAGGFGGYGIRARLHSAVSLKDSLLSGNRMAGLLVREYSSAEVRGCAIRDNLPTGNGEGGMGVYCNWAGEVLIDSSVIEGNGSAGLAAEHSGTTLTLERTVIRNSEPAGADSIAPGIGVGDGAAATLSGCLLTGNVGVELTAFDPGTDVAVYGSIVKDTKLELGGEYAIGIGVADGASVTVSTTVVERNIGMGVIASHAETSVTLQQSMVRNTLTPASSISAGIHANNGGLVTLLDCIIDSNRGAGLFVIGEGSRAVLERSVVRDTLPLPGAGAPGMWVADGGNAVIFDSLLTGNAGFGIAITDQQSEAALFKTTVRNTTAEHEGVSTAGIMAGAGSKVTLIDSVLEGNVGIGIAVADEGTEVTISGGVIRDTKNWNPACGAGYGILAGFDSSVTASGTVFERNCDAAIGTTHQARVFLDGVVLRETLDGPFGTGGYGLLASTGSTISLTGSLIEENLFAGAAALGSGTEITMQGTIVRNNLRTLTVWKPGEEEEYCGGYGLFAMVGAQASLLDCLFRGNGSIAVYALDAGTIISVSDSAILETTAGGGTSDDTDLQVFGDGLFAGIEAELNVASSLVAGNERSGVYYNNGSGKIADTVITANSSYGLTIEDCGEAVTYEDSGNVILGNALELPSRQSAEVTTTPEGLPTPPPPEVNLPE